MTPHKDNQCGTFIIDRQFTGMGPKEYWGKWQAGPNSVRIFGTKREARRRNVPLLFRPTPPSTETPSGFAQALRRAAGDVTELYERHEVARILDEDAERLRTYLGEIGRLKVVQGGQDA